MKGRKYEAAARRFHDLYEKLAPEFGYETRDETKDFEPQTPNGKLMMAVCEQLMGYHKEQMRDIAEMPEIDQDDAHRLRGKAKRYLSTF